MEAPQITAFLQEVQNHKGNTRPYPLERAMTLAEEHPELIGPLVYAIMDHPRQGETYYLDSLLSFLPLDPFPPLVEHAIAVLERDSINAAARSAVECASLQCLAAVAPHRELIFQKGYEAKWLWREAGRAASGFLRKYFEDDTQTNAVRLAAWSAAIETGAIDLLAAALASPPRDVMWVPVETYFAEAGYEVTADGFRTLFPSVTYHLNFDTSYYPIPENNWPWWYSHPTWNLTEQPACIVPFGGSIEPSGDGGESALHCALCGGELHHLLTLDPVPTGLGVTTTDRLTLCTCLSCLGWEESAESLFYLHDTAGKPTRNIGYEGELISPQFPSGPFLPTRVRLILTPERWRWQDRGMSNGRENLHRVGGHPCWVQSSQYPNCPHCQATMPFLMQLDSNLPTETDADFLWGSGGTAYIHWCDRCRISAIYWQCT